jgi:hypothetical protein
MSQIFISYASEDRARARALASELAGRGWSVWWDRKIPLGKSYDEVIERALAEAKCVVVLWSAVSVASEWVRNEAGEGRRREILLPVFLDPVEAPLAFRLLNGANLSDWEPSVPHPEFDRLVERVGELVGHHSPGAGAISAGAPSLPAQRTTREMVSIFFKSRLVRGGLATAFVGLFAVAYVLKFERSGQQDPASDVVPPTADSTAPKNPQLPPLQGRPGESEFEKSIRDLSKIFSGAGPATSMAKGFHVPDLGVRLAFISPEQSASTLGALPPGAVVMEVESGRPFAKAGLHVGDVIVSIAGKKIESEGDLRQAIFKIGPGNTRYSYRRDNATKAVTIECAACTVE